MSIVTFIFSRMCRSCMHIAPLNELHSIEESRCVGNDKNKMTIASLLNEVVPRLNVDAGDELPDKVCDKCVQNLLNMYAFQKTCLKSDRHIRTLVANQETEWEDEVPLSPTPMPDAGSSSAPAKPQQPIEAAHTYTIMPGDSLESQANYDGNESREAFNMVIEVDAAEIEMEDSCQITEKISNSNSTAPTDYGEQEAVTAAQEQNVQEAPIKFTCEYCDKILNTFNHLKVHKRTHTGERPDLCLMCGAAFKTYSTYHSHMVQHAAVRKFECPDCPKRFLTASHMRNHCAKVHINFKPHKCVICSSRFRMLCELKSHMLYHTKVKPFACKYCDKTFITAHKVREHARKHTGEKPYKCKYCRCTFAQCGNMNTHLRVHLGTNIHQCELCPKSFRLASERRIHFATHKHDDDETRQRHLQARQDLKVPIRGCVTCQYIVVARPLG